MREDLHCRGNSVCKDGEAEKGLFYLRTPTLVGVHKRRERKWQQPEIKLIGEVRL